MAKKKAGRKGKYDASWIQKVEEWGREGLIDSEIAKRLGIGVSTLYLYKNQHPEFAEALENSKKEADFKIKESLYKRALGYNIEEVEIIESDLGTTTKRKQRHIPGDVKAIQMWLQNREPDEWREKKEVAIEGDLVIDVTLGDEDEE